MKIICIGRNYIKHAKELNNPIPKEPVFFLKADSALLKQNKAFYYPEFSNAIHYELELVIKINRNGKHIAKRFAHKYYNEVGLGIDFTARDLQAKAKESGLPWEIAKSFDQSAPISSFFPINTLKNKENIEFYLLKNKEKVQHGFSKEMLFSIDEIIEYISQFMTLKMGDLIFTGTPAGVGAVKIGDVLEAFLEDEWVLRTEIR